VSASKTITLIVILLIAICAVLFTIQNLNRVSDLSLNLGFVAVHLKDPQPLPYLLWSAFGGGALCGVIFAALLGRGSRPASISHEGFGNAGVGATSDDWS